MNDARLSLCSGHENRSTLTVVIGALTSAAMRFLTLLLAILLTSCAAAKPKQKAKHKMGAAPSLDSSVCSDVPRWYRYVFSDLSTIQLDTPISTGFTCLTDLCLELFIPNDNYSKLVEGTDFTVDLTAGTITLLSSSGRQWGQSGSGQEGWQLIAYFNSLICPVVPECKAIECCEPDRYEYASSDASGSGQCSNAECLEPIIASNPVSGSQISVPSYVELLSNVPGAAIYYTLDGTAPTADSTEYTGPILIENIGTIIRAIGVMEGCSPGPITSIQFTNPSVPFVFAYFCDTPDYGGRWGDFAPNGTADNHWQVQFTLAGATTIKRLELYQLDSDGNWTTGQVWSTDSPIHPWPDRPEDDFQCFPLLVFDTAVQQWAAYQSSLGSFGAGTYTWDLYGNVTVAVGVTHLFRLDIILGDDSKLSQTISTTCVAVPPPLCPAPATPTAVGKCDGKVDVTFSGTVGQPYKIFAADTCDTGIFEEVAAGTIDVSPKTVEVSPFTADCQSFFYVSIQEAGCSYKDSDLVVAVPLAEPFVSIATNKTIVDPGESFTISWTSRNIGGAVCGGCLDGQVSIDQSLGCKTGNVAGSQATSQAVCGLYTYSITGCNTCGTMVASVQVEVRCEASCAADQEAVVAISNPDTLFGEGCSNLSGCISYHCEICYVPKWNGALFKTTDREPPNFICSYATFLATCGNGGQVKFGCDYGCPEDSPCMYPFSHATIDFRVDELRWELKIYSCDALVWEGIKILGNTALGVYAYNGGCANGPATVTVVSEVTP